MNIRIGTRGSDLALWQARHVAGRLTAAGHVCEIVILETRGDRLTHLAGVFADQHENGAEYDLAPVLGRGTVADLGADLDVGDVGDADRGVLAIGDDDARQIGFVRRLAGHADQEL